MTVCFVPRDWPGLKSAMCCGPPSSAASIRWRFSVSAYFSPLPAQFIIAESSGGPLLQTAVSLLGILIMIASANLLSWYKSVEGRSLQSRVKATDADLAGGEA